MKVKIKYHVCKICGKKTECAAEYCFVPDDECGAEHGGEHSQFPELEEAG